MSKGNTSKRRSRRFRFEERIRHKQYRGTIRMALFALKSDGRKVAMMIGPVPIILQEGRKVVISFHRR